MESLTEVVVVLTCLGLGPLVEIEKVEEVDSIS